MLTNQFLEIFIERCVIKSIFIDLRICIKYFGSVKNRNESYLTVATTVSIPIKSEARNHVNNKSAH